jgi:murein DD-endopeptidase MepM/ murein hydrolase activator NlpD
VITSSKFQKTRSTLLLALALALVLPATAFAGVAGMVGWTPEVGIDPESTIVDLDVDRDAFSPNGDGRADTLHIAFSSTVAQHVRISVLDATGALVRTIVDADVIAGPAAYDWDGVSDAAAPAADGAYQLVVDSGSGATSERVSEMIVVDRAAPVLTKLPDSVALTSQFARSFKLPVTLSEPALVDVSASGRAGRVPATSTEEQGRIQLAVPVINRPVLRRSLAKGPVRVRARIVATDDAGNRTVRRVGLELGYEAADVGAATRVEVVNPSRLSYPLSAPITSRFGPRWGRMHSGVDFGVPIGRPIGAAGPGRVTYAGWMSGYGNAVEIDHGGGISTLYAHQSQIVVQVGAGVGRGQVIGYSGNTGNSTGPHLHFEVHVNGAARDPLQFLP